MRTPAETEKLAREMDRQDPLAAFRDRFHIPSNTIYMDGNSLGLLSRDAEQAVLRLLVQWRTHAIGGYSLPKPDSWFEMGEQLGALMAPLVGASADEVVATGTTGVNLHQMLATFYQPTKSRRKIVATELDFPTDIHAIESHVRLHQLLPAENVVRVRSRDGRTIAEDDVIAAFDESVAVAILPSVLYRSGQLLDIARLTAAAHAKGIVVGFDCSHSVGVVPHHLNRDGVDFAVWCSYKYLNSGPGSVAALFVHRKHHGRLPGLQGWWGHDKATQFDMAHTFTPAQGAGAYQISSLPQLSAAPLRASLQIINEAGIDRIREKSLKLTSFLMALVNDFGELWGYRIGNPPEPTRRGGHVAVEHDEAARICKCLKKRGVIPDFRMPNVVRLAPVPLYSTFRDVWHTVQHLREIVQAKEYEQVSDGRDLIA